jgi:hypothetical protein
MYKEQIIEYTSKINDLEKKVDIMTKSMMSSSCIASLAGGGSAGYQSTLHSGDSESTFSLGEDDLGFSSSAMNQFNEREYQLALWVAKRWRYHQMTSFRVNIAKLVSFQIQILLFSKRPIFRLL